MSAWWNEAHEITNINNPLHLQMRSESFMSEMLRRFYLQHYMVEWKCMLHYIVLFILSVAQLPNYNPIIHYIGHLFHETGGIGRDKPEGCSETLEYLSLITSMGTTKNYLH